MPHTIANIAPLEPGAAVNLEADVLARYLQRMEAYQGVSILTTNLRAARMLVAVLSNASELPRMAEFHADMICNTVWVVHGKGKDADPSDTLVRIAMRGWGYVDNKTSAVSDTLTATRYVRSAPPAKAAKKPARKR